ncbi:hypothetical protein LCGC14_0912160 [marine sediment metagenome]|uniref:Uncharacterized protein n=1 Tax=marine sediment metagenome TaxID=412755 RepID=A0A0F9NXU5_9ZZZZ
MKGKNFLLPHYFFFKMAQQKIEAIDVATSFEKRIKTEDGEIGIVEAIAIIMQDIKEIKKGVL